MNRRTILKMASLSFLPASLLANNKKTDKSVILVWLSGGPPTIDMWDLKPNHKNGGPFKPISTTGDFQICEHLPLLAKLGKDFSIVRSMSTREADHARSTQIMHTAFAPSPTIQYPSLGSNVAYELSKERRGLEIPPYFSIDTPGAPGGFLGSNYNPFSVNSRGQVSNLGLPPRSAAKIEILNSIENEFANSGRGDLPRDHSSLLMRTLRLMSSKQMKALDIEDDPQYNIYPSSSFGRSALMARRLISQGVPFVEIGVGGWDLHANTHEILIDKLAELDATLFTLFVDLKHSGLWDKTAIVVMGEFGRTPRINAQAGRDHNANTWSAVLAGGLFNGGIAYGETSDDGVLVTKDPYTSADLFATVCHAVDIDITTKYTSKNGRPIKLGNSGKIICE